MDWWIRRALRALDLLPREAPCGGASRGSRSSARSARLIQWTGALLSQILWHDRMLVGILILIVKGNALTNFQLQQPTLELLKETLGSFLNGLNLTVNWAPIKSIVYDHILSFIICIMSWEIFTPFFLYIIQSLL